MNERCNEARAAARRAVTLQPEFWAHHSRLGHATWGDERLRAPREFPRNEIRCSSLDRL